MARPIAADATATRQRILSVAGMAFSEKGRSGTSIRSISSAAGVSLAMVHHYFGSKDGLYAACLDAMYAELAPLRDTMIAKLSKGGDFLSLIEYAVRTCFRFARSHQAPIRLLFRQITNRGELDPGLRAQRQIPFLDNATAALSVATGREPTTLRLPLQSAVMLIARYGISSETELRTFTGAGATTEKEATTLVEDHLVSIITAILQ